jgi:uncharacterized repeat protein (TIGR03803 family)
MSIRPCVRGLGRAGAAIALAGVLASGAGPGTGSGGGIEVLHSFTGNPDGEYPSTDLVLDEAGNLYGMAVLGGTYGSGAVFRLSPSKAGWNETVLYSFTSGLDGGQPYGGVTLDAEGNLYGTAVVGGTYGNCPEDGCGVVWKLTRSPGDAWTHSVIHDFDAVDGSGAGGPVVFDQLGNLYGMTPTGGPFGLGVVYQLAPKGPGAAWHYTMIHAFTGGDDGATGSAGRLLVDEQQNVYGVATVGGEHGVGTVFRISPSPGQGWTFTTLYSFQGEPDGVFPYGGLVRDANGRFYGTTYYGGEHGDGTVFRLSQRAAGWREEVLYSFTGEEDGAYPISHLVLGPNGSLYGTTSEDGAPGCSCGTLFQLSPPTSPLHALGKQSWTLQPLHAFEGAPDDGSYAYNGLVADAAGNLYGATVHGGEDDDGSVYRFTPPGPLR